MRRNRKKPFLTPAFAVALALLLTAGLLLAVNGISRQEKYAYLASLTPTPSAVPKKVSYAYDHQTPAPTALLLGSGREGPIVKEIQQRLKDLGYYTGLIDGQFGGQTRDAVIAFQKDRGLTADGLVGEETYALLMGNGS